MNEKLMALVDRIRERRIELGYSYGDLSAKTGISKSTLQRYETGYIRKLDYSKVKIIAEALGVTVRYLEGRKEIDTKFANQVYSLLYDVKLTPEDEEEITRHIKYIVSKSEKEGEDV